MEIDREQTELILKQVFSVCGRLHPAVRRSLGAEAKRLWRLRIAVVGLTRAPTRGCAWCYL